MKRVSLVLQVVFLLAIKVNAQLSDSLSISVGTTATVATYNYQPFWIVANQYGTISNRGNDLSSNIRISNVHLVPIKRLYAGSGQDYTNPVYVKYGVGLYQNNNFRDFFAKEGYVKLGYSAWELRGGRYTEVIGEVDPELSSGSFAISRNALPIPKVGVAVTDYIDVPFTRGWLRVKGLYSHGWLGSSNFVKGAFLHEKNLYLKLGKEKLSLYAGINHFAQWGGTHPAGPTPSRLKDYLRIVVGAQGDEDDPRYQQGPVDIVNAVGNHIVVSDIGLQFKNHETVFHLYTQTIFDKGVGAADERDKIKAFNVFGKDRMVGLSLELKNNSFIRNVVVEGIYTKDQGGPVLYEGRFNYYNNGTYMTGWEYRGSIIGTPLFLSRKQAEKYTLDQTKPNQGNWNIMSNRITGVHVGMRGSFTSKTSYRLLATYVQHYGNYDNDETFSPAKKQIFVLNEIAFKINKSMAITAALGKDVGSLSDNTGGRMSLDWRIK